MKNKLNNSNIYLIFIFLFTFSFSNAFSDPFNLARSFGDLTYYTKQDSDKTYAAIIQDELSLQEVTRFALENNLDIQIAKFDAYMGRTSLKKTYSLFDTYLEAHATYFRDRSQQASVFAGSDSRDTSYGFGFSKKLLSGTTLSMDADTSKIRTDSSFSSLNPYNQAKVGFSIKQELGKNFFGLADRSEIKITKIDIENLDFTSLEKIEEAIFSVQKAFWQLALREEEVLISLEMLQEAEKLFATYKDKKPLGLVEESEFLAIEALVITRRISLKIAELARDTANSELLFVLNIPELDKKLKLKDVLKADTKTVILYDELKEALSHRRDYKKIKNELEKNDIVLAVKKNALWPQIDLEATFSRNNLHDDRETAWGHLAQENSDQLYVGFNVKFPLEQSAERSELEFTSLEKKQLAVKFHQTEISILKELSNEVNKVNTYANQTRLHEKIAKLHQEKLVQQKKRLDYGRSDVDTLVRYEEDLFTAQLTLARSLYDYRLSLLELDLKKNTLLDRYWQDPL